MFLFSISLLLSACPPLPQHIYDKVEYKAITRGSSESILIETIDRGKTKLTHSKNSKEQINRVLNKKESLGLYSILRSLDHTQIDQLEVPSKKHQYDGALVTTIEITVRNKAYRSVSFDHDNPPKELKSLINNTGDR